MTEHGLRDSRFAWVERSENRCVLVLEESEARCALYLFAFRVVVTYTVDEHGLDVAQIVNPVRRHCGPRSAAIRLSTGRFSPEGQRKATR